MGDGAAAIERSEQERLWRACIFVFARGDEVKQAALLDVLIRGGNVSDAAARHQVSPRTLRHWVREFRGMLVAAMGTERRAGYGSA